MTRHFFAGNICIALLLSFLSCAGGAATRDAKNQLQNQRQSETNSDINKSSLSYFSGDGRKDMSLAILVPEGRGLDTDHAYLPLMIQGCLVANISKYSAIRVLDRVALDKVIAETLDPTYRDNLDIVRLGHITQTEYIMTGTIISNSYGYTLTINITDTTPNPQTKAFSGNYTISQLYDQSAVQHASKELLALMGVNLSDRAISELNAANQQSINAQAVLAKGITAQQQGLEIVALSYYLQAAKFDPFLPEAATRSEILAADISSGNIGEDLRGDVQWRRNWIARLAETEQYVKNYDEYYFKYYTDYYNNFYREYNASWDSLVNQQNVILNQRSNYINSLPAPPYTLYYAVNVRNSGVIDYKTETTSFTGIKALLRSGSPDWKQSIEKAIQSANDSVREMHLAEQDLQRKISEVQQMVQAEQLIVEAAMREVVKTVNDGLNATGRREVWLLNPLNVTLSSARLDNNRLKTAKPNVLPINKTGNESFSITVELVNSQNKVIGTNTFRTSGTYSITDAMISLSNDEQNTVDFMNVNVNDITENLTIRIARVNGVAAESASRSGGLQIQAVNAAEWDSAPWDYTIQRGQITQYMGKGGSVTIPHIIWGEIVTSIGDNVFANSQLTNVNIGANITLGSSAIGSGFEGFYNRNGKIAGTYIRHDSSSNIWGNNLEELDFLFDPATGTIIGYRGNISKITIPETIGGVPITAIANNVFQLPAKPRIASAWDTNHNSWVDNSGYSPGQTTVVIKIGKGIKLDNTAFTGPDFGAYYSMKGRKAGTYSYTYTSNKIIRNVFMGLLTPTLFLTIIPARFIPYGQWGWKHTRDI